MAGEDIGGVDAEAGAELLTAEVGVDDVELLAGGIDAEGVAVAFPGEVAFIQKLGEEPAVSPVIHRDLAGGDPFVPPPVVSGVGEVSGLDLVPEPISEEWAAELIDEHLLEALEEILRDFEEAAKLGACGADEDHEGLGGQADASGDLAHEGADEGLEGSGGVFVFEGFDGFAGAELGDEGAVVECLGR